MTKPNKTIQKKAPRALKREPKKTNVKYELTKPMKEALDEYQNEKTQYSRNILLYERRDLPNLPGSGQALINVIPNIYMMSSSPVLHDGGNRRFLRNSNKIRLKSCKLKLTFYLPIVRQITETNYEDNKHASLYFIVAILSSKTYPRAEDAALNWGVSDTIKNKIFERGVDGLTNVNDNGIPNTGAADRMQLPFNRRAFTVHDEKRFFMNRGSLPGAATASTENLGGHMPALTKEINMEYKCKNHLAIFENNISYRPFNGDPFLYIAYAFTDGSATTTGGYPQMWGISTVKWESTAT